MIMTAGKLTFNFSTFPMHACISSFVNVVVLYRIRSGQSQSGIYDNMRVICLMAT